MRTTRQVTEYKCDRCQSVFEEVNQLHQIAVLRQSTSYDLSARYGDDIDSDSILRGVDVCVPCLQLFDQFMESGK